MKLPLYRTCEAVIPGIVTKCLNARPKTKQSAMDVCLMYTEIEQQAVVQVLNVLQWSVVETNAMAQEKALEATLAFVECAAIAGRYMYRVYTTCTCILHVM